MTQPITEASNPITEEIDVSLPIDIVSLLERCDQEIFDGFKAYKTLFHKETITTIENVADNICAILNNPQDGLIVFSGCGTSGRLGFIVARTFNEILSQKGEIPHVFHYLLAGGDKALFTSQEAPEDDPRVGVEGLKQLSFGKRRVVFIGITCGLSAPYVAGQLEYCMDHLDTFIPVVLGFNPVELSRNVKIETWDRTFRDVIHRMEGCISEGKQCFILNPIIGPEPITGSSRMKSGSTTKILLETMCMKALTAVFNKDAKWFVPDYLNAYRRVSETVYQQKQDIGAVVQLAGNSLSDNGNIYYLGNDSLALMGLIDASECPPTYGATLDDVRGFVKDGYQTLRNNEGSLSELGKHFRISLDDFSNDIPLSEKDTVIVLNTVDSATIPAKVVSSKCKKVLITFEKEQNTSYDVIVTLNLPSNEIDRLIGDSTRQLANQMFREIAIKWCLNAVTTGAHILKGKVYRNIMIDVKVSNNKLFHRAVGILKKLGNLDEGRATEFLLRSIYDVDEIPAGINNDPVAKHILQATPKERVVPTALVSAVLKCPIAKAKEILSTDRIIRHSVVNVLKNAS